MDRVKVEGYKKDVPHSLIERVFDLAASGMGPRAIGIECGISKDKALAVLGMNAIGRAKVIAAGGAAEPGQECPYKMSEIGLRCAWLAGHYDKHGREAWEVARK